MNDFLNEYLPEAAYGMAADGFNALLESDPGVAEEIVEMLELRLAEEINSADMSEDEDEASAQLRNIVLRLQTVAFIAGSIWKGMIQDEETEQTEGSLSLVLTSEQKLELTRDLLNGDGISLKIL